MSDTEKRLASAHPSRQSFNAAVEHIRLHAPMTLATENALTIIEAFGDLVKLDDFESSSRAHDRLYQLGGVSSNISERDKP